MPPIERWLTNTLTALPLVLCATLCALGVEVRYPVAVACLMALSIAWPTARVWQYCQQRALVRHRIAVGQCPACGYDLTGNVSGVCPECGRKIGEGSKSALSGTSRTSERGLGPGGR